MSPEPNWAGGDTAAAGGGGGSSGDTLELTPAVDEVGLTITAPDGAANNGSEQIHVGGDTGGIFVVDGAGSMIANADTTEGGWHELRLDGQAMLVVKKNNAWLRVPATTGTSGVQIGTSSGAIVHGKYNTGAGQHELGFYGTTPVLKPTVSGSRGGNAALASLLTALAGLGLITDGSSA